MRNLKKLFLGLALGAALFTSCKGDDPAGPTDPTISATPSTATAAPGSSVQINVIANAATGAKLTKYKVVLQVSGSPDNTLKDSAISSTQSFSNAFTYAVPSTATGTHTLIFSVTDDAGQTASANTAITVAGFSQVENCGNKTLGNQNSTTGSSFATATCSVLAINQAKANPGSVDFLHYYGAVNAATLASPSDQSLNVFTAFDITTWATRNVTNFKKLTGVDYDATNTAAAIQTAYTSSSATESTLAIQLAKGDIVGFKTQDGRYGIIRVGDISGSNTTTGTLAFESKVQE